MCGGKVLSVFYHGFWQSTWSVLQRKENQRWHTDNGLNKVACSCKFKSLYPVLPELFKKRSIWNRQTIHQRAITVTGLAGASRRWIFRIYSHQDGSGYFDFCLHQNCASFACLIKSNQLSDNPHLSEAHFTLVRTTAACDCFILCSLYRQALFKMVWRQ